MRYVVKSLPEELYCRLNSEVILKCCSFPFVLLCFMSLQPRFLVCCPLCLAHIKKKKNEKKVCCGLSGIETYFYSFNVRSQQILFFQHNAFLNDSSKNVYFNIYLLQDMYIFVIYN